MRAGTMALLGLVAGRAALAGDDPQGWLQRMAYALEFLNYEGTLVQMQGSDAAIMRVVHRVEDGVPTERITALDAVGREIIRRGDEVTIILPDQQSVLVGAEPSAESPLRQQFGSDPRFDPRFYRLAIASGEKLVGRDTRVVTVRPADAFRYGYRLWLDHATAMPLKVQIVDGDGESVEQLFFSDIALPERISPQAVQPSAATSSFTWRRSVPAAFAVPPGAGARGNSAGAAEPPRNWQVGRLPPGFTLRAAREQPAAGRTGTIQQWIYADGVATVSVFVEAGVSPADEAGGPSRMGAANAYSLLVDGHLVTAVGEVPARTVESIARSLRPR